MLGMHFQQWFTKLKTKYVYRSLYSDSESSGSVNTRRSMNPRYHAVHKLLRRNRQLRKQLWQCFKRGNDITATLFGNTYFEGAEILVHDYFTEHPMKYK